MSCHPFPLPYLKTLEKATLKNELKEELSVINALPGAVVIDGCAMLQGGKADDLIKTVRSYISKKLSTSDVYLIFDRYKDFSIKSDTRLERLGQFPLPTKEVTLKATKTMKQLIPMVASDLLDNLHHNSTAR